MKVHGLPVVFFIASKSNLQRCCLAIILQELSAPQSDGPMDVRHTKGSELNDIPRLT